MRTQKTLWLIVLGLTLAGCQGNPAPQPTSTVQAGPTSATALAPSPTPSATPQASGPCQPIQTVATGEWVPVADPQTGYHFEIPAGWSRDPATQPGVLLFYSDPLQANQAQPTGGLCGLVKFEVVIDSIGSWIGWVPDPDMQQTTVAGLPAWRADVSLPQANGQETKTSSFYFSAGKYFYTLTATYFPPEGTSPDAAGQFQAAADSIFAKIVKVMQIQLVPN